MATVDKGNRRSLYVGGLDRQVTEQALYSAFVPFGPLKAVQIPLDFKAQTSKGFGFVEFEDEADARAAIDNMDESELFGRTLRVSMAKPDRPKLGSKKPVWAQADEIENGTDAVELEAPADASS